jgi:hypothetical protein
MGQELTTRRLLAMIAAGLVLVIGVLGMWQSVYLSDFDRYGIKIRCGTGFVADFTHAEIADGGVGEHSKQCDTALLVRRAWAIPAAVLGAGSLVTLALGGTRVVNPQSQK